MLGLRSIRGNDLDYTIRHRLNQSVHDGEEASERFSIDHFSSQDP
jgi:hypothetical protein